MPEKRTIHAAASLSEANYEKLCKFAELRGEDVQETLDRLLSLSVKRVPGNLRDADAPLDDFPLIDAGLDGGLPWIRLANDRVFYSHPTKLRYANLYHLMRDRSPNVLSPETFQSAIEARRLYWNAARYKHFPAPGSTVVDAGAYVGYKAIGFADAVGPGGYVIAIEVDHQNFQLLQRNIEENGLTDRIAAHHTGVWSSTDELPYTGTSHMQHALVPLDHTDYPLRGTVTVRPLDDIFDAAQVEQIDFLNIQVNGAEVEALRGLQRWWPRIGIVRVAAYYSRDGVSTAPQVRQLLESRSAQILQVSEMGSITAAGPATPGKADRTHD